jgi:hypothetical protein
MGRGTGTTDFARGRAAIRTRDRRCQGRRSSRSGASPPLASRGDSSASEPNTKSGLRHDQFFARETARAHFEIRHLRSGRLPARSTSPLARIGSHRAVRKTGRDRGFSAQISFRMCDGRLWRGAVGRGSGGGGTARSVFLAQDRSRPSNRPVEASPANDGRKNRPVRQKV